MSEKTAAQKKAQQKYMEKFSVARVRMDRERYERVQAHAEAQGESVNAFINRAISEAMERDGGGAAAPGAAPVERVLAETPAEGSQEAAETAQGGAGWYPCPLTR